MTEEKVELDELESIREMANNLMYAAYMTAGTRRAAAEILETSAQTIERLTRELDETRAEVTRLNALINTPQPVITGIWRRSVI